MEGNKEININELARVSGVKYYKIWTALSYGGANKLKDEDKQKILDAIPVIKESVDKSFDELTAFFR